MCVTNSHLSLNTLSREDVGAMQSFLAVETKVQYISWCQ